MPLIKGNLKIVMKRVPQQMNRQIHMKSNKDLAIKYSILRHMSFGSMSGLTDGIIMSSFLMLVESQWGIDPNTISCHIGYKSQSIKLLDMKRIDRRVIGNCGIRNSVCSNNAGHDTTATSYDCLSYDCHRTIQVYLRCKYLMKIFLSYSGDRFLAHIIHGVALGI